MDSLKTKEVGFSKNKLLNLIGAGAIFCSALTISGCQSLKYANYPKESSRPNLSYSIDERISQMDFLEDNENVVKSYSLGEDFNRDSLDSIFDLTTHILVEKYNNIIETDPAAARKDKRKPIEHTLDRIFDREDSDALSKMDIELSRKSMSETFIAAKDVLWNNIYELFSSKPETLEKYLLDSTNITQISDIFSFMERHDETGMEFPLLLDNIINRSIKSNNYELLNRMYLGKLFRNFEKPIFSGTENYTIEDSIIVSNRASFSIPKIINSKAINDVIFAIKRDYFSRFEKYEGQMTSVIPGKSKTGLKYAQSDDKIYLSEDILTRIFKEGTEPILSKYK